MLPVEAGHKMIYKSSEEKKNPLSVFLAELSGFTLSRVPAFFFFFFNFV